MAGRREFPTQVHLREVEAGEDISLVEKPEGNLEPLTEKEQADADAAALERGRIQAALD